jgi:hypothetical protein
MKSDDPIDHQIFSGEERDLLIKRLAACGLPTREMVRITGASPRTVARIMQKLGIQRKKPERFPPSRKRRAQRLFEILTQFYALKEPTLDSLIHLARNNGISLGKLLNLIREQVSPPRWAIRSCLSCEQPSLTSSPSDRYCQSCKKKMRKARECTDDSAIYD